MRTDSRNEDIPGFIKAENSVSMLVGPSLSNQTLHVTIAEGTDANAGRIGGADVTADTIIAV